VRMARLAVSTCALQVELVSDQCPMSRKLLHLMGAFIVKNMVLDGITFG